jgi:hypothetical protein
MDTANVKQVYENNLYSACWLDNYLLTLLVLKLGFVIGK